MKKESTKKKAKAAAKVTPESPGTSLAKRKDQAELSKGFDDMFTEFRRSFDDIVSPLLSLTNEGTSFPIRSAPVDLIDNGDSLTVKAELPGFDKDMVDVQVTKDGVAITAERVEETEEEGDYLHRERAYSAMQRYVAFPEQVLPAEAEGSMEHGVLELKIPKRELKPEEKPKKVELK